MQPTRRAILAAAAATIAVPRIARAADPLRIGFITTLSTPAGYIGEDCRDGFQLAITESGGALGGVPIELVIEDDGLKPASAKASADRMVQSGVKLVTGTIFSNVAEAIVPGVVDNGAFFISLNPGPAPFAGAGCKPNYIVASYQNDSAHEACGLAANELGYKKITLLAPNYQAGRDALTGFKRAFKGEIAAEIYTRLDQSDFSVELARLRQLDAQGLYEFVPGGGGINFVKQYGSAGLAAKLPLLLGPYAMDARMIAATGDAARGLYMAAAWSPMLDNPANKAFVAAFTAAYKRMPTIYAAQAYDTARLIASGLKVSGPTLGAPFRTAVLKADYAATRGHVSFNTNQHAVLDYSLMQIEPDANGILVPMVKRPVAQQLRDTYAGACALPA